MEMAGKPHENNPWSTLSTVNTFDKGNHSWTTRCVDETEVQNGGQIVGRVVPATSLLIESLIQQLCTVFEDDGLRRNKLYYAICDRLHEMKLIDGSYNKIEFETMRGQYQVALYKLVAVARALTGSESTLKVPSCLIAEWSRYRREFIEIGFIAAGGFGNVFKAKHRLDGNVYAIKKIVVRSGRVKTIMKHLEEVKTIARLNHTNIVSYKGAWIEQNFPSTFVPSLPVCVNRNGEKSATTKSIDNDITGSRETNENEMSSRSNDTSDSNELCRSKSESTGENIRSSEEKNFTYKTGMYVSSIANKSASELCGSSGGYIISHDIINERFEKLNSTNNIIGERISERLGSRMDDDELSDIVSFRSETRESNIIDDNGNVSSNEISLIDEINRGENYDDSDSCDEAASEQRLRKFNSSLPSQYATLYIQMALCDQTLRQWLDERNEPTPMHTVTSIMTQILSGLEYIHSLDIVHHDIKPSNILITKSGNLQIQLGDFGLACPLQREGHHSVLGTPTYAAPEQLNGKCDPKSDVYSLGIVLLELLFPMQTHMERSGVIAAIKKGQIPAVLTTSYPQWSRIIRQLVQENPKKRPSPSEILRNLSQDKDSLITMLKEENAKKDDIIQKLQDRIAQLIETIEKHQISLENT